jgi:hypothetical protein
MRPQVHYAFAKDKGFAVIPGRVPMTVAVREGADVLALPEVRRVLGTSFQLEAHSAIAFEKLLSEGFGGGALDGTAAAAAEKQENLETLFDGIPQTEDLLAGDGDAPWPPHYRKAAGEPKRAPPSARKPSKPLVEIGRSERLEEAMAFIVSRTFSR